MKKKRKKYIFAYDPTIHRRVIYVVIGNIATSLITGHEFKYDPRKT